MRAERRERLCSLSRDVRTDEMVEVFLRETESLRARELHRGKVSAVARSSAFGVFRSGAIMKNHQTPRGA